MSAELIQSEFSDGILTVRINRPEKKNALTVAMYGALADAFEHAENDPGVRVVLLCGSNGCFTSGNDLADFVNFKPLAPGSPVLRFFNTVAGATKPVIASVSGPAIGVGTTILLHCDLVYADDTALFQMPFVSLGLCPEAGSTLLLPRLIGHQRASELLLFGEPFTAARAEHLGIVTSVLRYEDHAAAVRAKALQMAAQPAAAVRVTKALLKRDHAGQLLETAQYEIERFMELLALPEAQEAVQAFMERRKPDFTQFD